MSAALHGVHLSGHAAARLRSLVPEQRDRVAHVLEEMIAVVELTASSIQIDGFPQDRLHFVAAGVRVEYSIDAGTGLLTVHDIIQAYQRAG